MSEQMKVGIQLFTEGKWADAIKSFEEAKAAGISDAKVMHYFTHTYYFYYTRKM